MAASSHYFLLVCQQQLVNADKYFTPITPNGWTFSIWGFIFTGEALYAIFQLLPSQRNRAYHKDIAGWVMCAFVLQSLWLVCWYGLALRLCLPHSVMHLSSMLVSDRAL